MKDLGHLSYFLGLEISNSIDGLYIILLKPSMLPNFCLELDSLIVKLLTLQLNLMHI